MGREKETLGIQIHFQSPWHWLVHLYLCPESRLLTQTRRLSATGFSAYSLVTH